MNEIKTDSRPFDQRQILLALNFLLVSVMLASFAFFMGNFFQTLYPNWVSILFPALGFLIALESLIMRYLGQTSSRVLNNYFLATLTEIILILVVIKFVSLLLSGFSTIWLEIVSWQYGFFHNFFKPDTILRMGGLMLVWLLAWLFSQPLIQLDEDETLMVQEKLGFTFNDRQVARRTLISLVFSLGFVMILLLVIMKGSIELIPNNTIPTRHFVIVLLIYFFSAFIFLGLNQYAIMKARWYFNDISVNSDLAKRWFFYTLVFVLIVITVIIFLPTNFTLGFIPVAKFLSQVFIYLFALIQFVIFIPIAFLISVVNALFSGESTSEPTPQIMPEFIAPVLQQTANTAPWWEIAKSILFWFIFLAVIIFSIRYYFKNKQDFKSLFNGIRIAEWLRDFWKWISRAVRIATQAAGETFQNQFNNMRNYFKDHQIKFPALADLVRNMPPRQAVILTYLDWIRWNKSNGFDRHRSQTPIEYALAYSRTLPESAETINTFTGIFIKARYSRQTIDGSQAEKAKDLLVSLKETYRQSQKAAEIVQ